MGIPGQYNHARMRQAYETTARAARAHGKWMGVGGVREDLEFQTWLLQLGMRYLTGGSDVGYILSAGRADVKRCAGAASSRHVPSFGHVPSFAVLSCAGAADRQRVMAQAPPPRSRSLSPGGSFASRPSPIGSPTRRAFPSLIGAFSAPGATRPGTPILARRWSSLKCSRTAPRRSSTFTGPSDRARGCPAACCTAPGIIRDDELRFQNSDGTQFAFRPAIADLVGQMTKPSGQTYRSEFKKTFWRYAPM